MADVQSWYAVPDWWVAITTALLFVATAVLVLVAGVQISAAREEARKNRTLEICNRYDLDPILDRTQRTLFNAREAGTLNQCPEKYRFEVDNLLNYLESIAIGIDRQIYDKTIVRDYMQQIMCKHVDLLVTSGIARSFKDSTPDDYSALENPCSEWRMPRPKI